MGPSQNLLLPPRIYPPFLQLYMQNTHSLNIYLLPSENLPLPPRIYPLFHLRTSQNLPSHITPPFKHLYATLPESTPPSQNIPLFYDLYATLRESPPPCLYPQLYVTFP